MSSENFFIREFYQKLTSGGLTKSDIKNAEKRYPSSPIILYYIGMHYDEKHDTLMAKKYFKKCISIIPRFTYPLFQLGNYYTSATEFLNEYENSLVELLNTSTLNPITGMMEYRLVDQLHICDLLSQSTKRYTDEFEKVILHFETTVSVSLEAVSEKKVVQGYKNLCMTLSIYYLEYANQPEKAMRFLMKSFKYTDANVSDVPALKRYKIVKNYVVGKYKLPKNTEVLFGNNEQEIELGNFTRPSPISFVSLLSNRKINIGYISMDFNKSAVGLFSIPLLKYYNEDRFNVFCYSTNKNSDCFTQMFRSYKNNWFDVSHMTDDEAYSLIKSHNIDILVDLACFSVDSRIELAVKKPAKILINYIGYPSVSNLISYDYRIVDHITDPVDSPLDRKDNNDDYTETLIRMPRCFLCYHLFENVLLPDIESKLGEDEVTIGITSRFGKFHPVLIRAWEKIFTALPRARFLVKSEIKMPTSKLIDDSEILKKHVVYIPFVDKPDLISALQNYLKYMNSFDFVLDTFPYSGTTTTCSSLLGGRAVFTIYDKNNEHRSNVSTSILRCCGEEYNKYIANSLEEYSDKVINFCKDKNNIAMLRDINYCQKIRRDFLNAMEPRKWMKEYEALMQGLVHF
jgi:predicted O-linked N-acetylglucosamine transferase (SPINDLY family)